MKIKIDWQSKIEKYLELKKSENKTQNDFCESENIKINTFKKKFKDYKNDNGFQKISQIIKPKWITNKYIQKIADFKIEDTNKMIQEIIFRFELNYLLDLVKKKNIFSEDIQIEFDMYFQEIIKLSHNDNQINKLKRHWYKIQKKCNHPFIPKFRTQNEELPVNDATLFDIFIKNSAMKNEISEFVNNNPDYEYIKPCETCDSYDNYFNIFEEIVTNGDFKIRDFFEKSINKHNIKKQYSILKNLAGSKPNVFASVNLNYSNDEIFRSFKNWLQETRKILPQEPERLGKSKEISAITILSDIIISHKLYYIDCALYCKILNKQNITMTKFNDWFYGKKDIQITDTKQYNENMKILKTLNIDTISKLSMLYKTI